MLDKAINIATDGQEGQGAELSPEQARDAKNYQTVLTKIMHGKENRDNIMGLLQSYGQPELAVPEAAQMVMDQADQIIGKRAPNEYRLGLSGFVIGDLIELGNAAKLWPAVSEDEAKNIYQDTVQDAIHRGLKDRTIDPVELQKSAEPLMNQQQKEIGAAHAIKAGVPPVVDPRAVNNLETQKKVEAARKQSQPKAAINTGGQG